MNIVGKNVILRAIEDSDTILLLEMVNDPQIEAMIGGWSWPVSHNEQEAWIIKERSNSNTKRFIVEIAGKPMGLVILANLDWKNRCAFTGIKLHPEAPKNCGIGTDAMMTLQKYAFTELQLHRLETTWLEYNKASEKLHIKCGWKIEGLARLAVFKQGRYHNLVYGSILAEDFFRIDTVNQDV